MKNQMTFQRYEIKYLLTYQQMQKMKQLMWKYMEPDQYGKSLIQSIYLDTPDYRMIGHSLERPVYKEKMRLRSYGMADENTKVFLELKKKYKSVVYKRRISMEYAQALHYLSGGRLPEDSQIGREIDYTFHYYPSLAPRVLIQCHREAFYGREDPDFRITFDIDISWRDFALSLSSGEFGEPILGAQRVLLEIKTAQNLPLWLTQFLTEENLFKTSFSKYGTAYQRIQREEIQEKRRILDYQDAYKKLERGRRSYA